MRPITLSLSLCLLLGLAACPGQPTVPESMLTEIPPAAISEVQPLQERADQLREEVASAQAALREAEREEAAQIERLDVAREAVRADERLKELAVQRGDAAGAAAADDRRYAGTRVVEQAEVQLRTATTRREQAEAELALLEAERDLLDARTELARARAVEGQVEGFDVGPFEWVVANALDRRDAAA
jgi:hypothetical protein